MLENRDILAPVFKTALEVRKNKNTLVPDLETLSVMKKVKVLWVTLTNNDIKDIIKVIRSLENRGSLLKGIATKINSQKGGFLNFFIPLMTTALPLMKNL